MSTKIPLRADAKTHIRTPEKTSCTVGETHAHTHALLSLGGEVRGQIQIMMLRQLIILSGKPRSKTERNNRNTAASSGGKWTLYFHIVPVLSKLIKDTISARCSDELHQCAQQISPLVFKGPKHNNHHVLRSVFSLNTEKAAENSPPCPLTYRQGTILSFMAKEANNVVASETRKCQMEFGARESQSSCSFFSRPVSSPLVDMTSRPCSELTLAVDQSPQIWNHLRLICCSDKRARQQTAWSGPYLIMRHMKQPHQQKRHTHTDTHCFKAATHTRYMCKQTYELKKHMQTQKKRVHRKKPLKIKSVVFFLMADNFI